MKTQILLLLLFAEVIVGQFGAGGSIYLPGNALGSSFAYSYPWTGIAEARSDKYTIEFWAWFERSQADYQGCVLSVAVEGDDNLFIFGRASLLNWHTEEFILYEGVDEFNKERRWIHYAAVADFTIPEPKVNIYVNGKYQGTPPTTEFSKTMSRYVPWSMVLGGDQDAFLSGFVPPQMSPGMNDNLRIWNKALTVDEIKYHMSHAVTGREADLLSAWNFDEGTGYSSRELVTGRPSWAFYFGSVTVDPKLMMAYDHESFKGELKTIWGYSGARCRGIGLTIHVAPNVKTLIDIRDLTDTGGYIITSLSAGELFVEGTNTLVVVGQTVTTNVIYVGPVWMSATVGARQTMTFRVGVEVQTITLKYSPPLVPRDLIVVIPEDSKVIDGDVVLEEQYDNPDAVETVIVITRLPSRGKLYYQQSNTKSAWLFPDVVAGEITEPYSFVVTADGAGGWTSLLFEPLPNEYSIRYTDFDYAVVDKARFNDMDAIKQLPQATVYIQVPASNDLPELEDGKVNFTTTQDTEVLLNYKVLDFDGDDPIIELMSTPKHGDLWLTDKVGNKIRKLTKTAAGVDELEQHATTLLNYSTQYIGPDNKWAATQALGPPMKDKRFGDSGLAWAPFEASNCVDKGNGDLFWTEFIHVKWDVPIYIKHIYTFENVGVGSVVGLRTKDNTTNTWKRLYAGDHTVPVIPDEYLIQKPPGMCSTWYFADELIVELDACNTPGWNEIDAFLIVGSIDPNTGYIPPNSSVVYVPENGFTGVDTFEFKLTDCPGNRFRRTESYFTHIDVTAAAAENTATLEGKEGASNRIAFKGTGPWQVTSAPKFGKLVSGGKTLSKYSIITFPEATYRADEALCTNLQTQYMDSFAIVSGSTMNQAMSYNVRGCKLKKKFPFWIFGIIGVVIVIAGLVGFWFSTKQRRKMAALYNNNKIAEECAEAIAWMRLEEVSYLSALQNPNKIQKAFLKIIKTLEEYRNYMPSSLLVDSSEEEKSGDSDGIGTKESSSAGKSEKSKTNNSMLSSVNNKGRLAHLQVGQLRNKAVSIVTINLSGFRKLDEQILISTHTEYLNHTLTTVKRFKGIPESFTGDRICISWNAVMNCSIHRQNALKAAVHLVDNKNLVIQAGCSSSECRVGNMGVIGMKKFAIIGDCISESFALMRLNKMFDTSILADGKFRVEEGNFHMNIVTRILFENTSVKPTLIYEIVSCKEDLGGEWMYNLAASRDLVLECVDSLIAQNPVSAADLKIPKISDFIVQALIRDANFVDEKSKLLKLF